MAVLLKPAQLVLLKAGAYRLSGLMIGGRMAGLKERLTERRAKKRAARDERRMRRAMDPRTGLGAHDVSNSVDVELYKHRSVGREFGPREYGP